MYTPVNRVSTTLTAEFVHGTDTSLSVTSVTGMETGGGYIRIFEKLPTGVAFAVYEYTGITTLTLTGLVLATLGNVESTAAHTFAVGTTVEVTTAAEYIQDVADAAVLEADFNANTILAANADDTPLALTIAEQTMLGRITAGNIAALTPAQIRTLLNVADGAGAQTPWTSDIDAAGYGISDLKTLDFSDATTVTIATGAVTLTQGNHTIDTEAAAATDDLDTINGLGNGEIAFLRAADGSRTVVLKHGTGNILIPGDSDYSLDDATKMIQVLGDGTNVHLVGAAGGSGTDGDAIHDNVSGEISAITEKTLPTGSDLLLIEDAAASNAKKKVEVASINVDNLSNLAFNKMIQPGKCFRIISFDSYDMFLTDVAGSGSVTQSLGLTNIRTGTTASSYARQNTNTAAGTGLYSGGKIAFYIYTGNLTGDVVCFVGSTLTLHSTQTNHTWTCKHAGLFYDNGYFYTSTGNGTTQELTDVTSSISAQNWLKILYDGTNVKFYCGDTLVATHTTFASGGYASFWINNKTGTVDNYLQVYNFFKRGIV